MFSISDLKEHNFVKRNGIFQGRIKPKTMMGLKFNTICKSIVILLYFEYNVASTCRYHTFGSLMRKVKSRHVMMTSIWFHFWLSFRDDTFPLAEHFWQRLITGDGCKMYNNII